MASAKGVACGLGQAHNTLNKSDKFLCFGSFLMRIYPRALSLCGLQSFRTDDRFELRFGSLWVEKHRTVSTCADGLITRMRSTLGTLHKVSLSQDMKLILNIKIK